MRKTLPAPDVVIDKLGGTTAVAQKLGIRPASVSGWRSSGIPQARLPQLASDIEKVFKIPRHVLCPTVFEAPKSDAI